MEVRLINPSCIIIMYYNNGDVVFVEIIYYYPFFIIRGECSGRSSSIIYWRRTGCVSERVMVCDDIVTATLPSAANHQAMKRLSSYLVE